ncbi:MAG: carbon-nitrogen hydrolase family protein, partial [Hyphomicrobiales bacterium]|nr:carbon-nitrogen hydrolase family protein [Hyphomicrobiales bacterium]
MMRQASGTGGPLKVLAGQIDIPQTRSVGERDAHVARLCERVESELARRNADLVVLPELSTIDYSRDAFCRLDELAEDADGPSAQAFARLAERTGVAVLYGFARRAGDGYRISQQLVRPDGTPAGYFDKIHMAQFGASMEKEFFERGDRLCVFELKGYRIAPMICYDIRVPEMARALALEHGVDAIFHC